MKTDSPYDRGDIHINKNDKVLEIGPGHNPTYRSNVIAEKFIDTNYHRCGDVKIYPHQTFVHADGENLPFKDKEFDYVICNQVLEHVEHPEAFVKELCRVARRGYIETPSLLGEYLFPKKSHKWVILDIDNKLVFYEKNKMPGNYENDYGELFLNYLPFQSLPYKLLWLTEGDITLNRYEWKEEVEILVNPEDEYYSSFFLNKWNREMVEKLYPRRSALTEMKKMIQALFYILKNKFKSRFSNHRNPVTLSEYIKTHEVVALCRNVVKMLDNIKQTSADIRFETELTSLEIETDQGRLQQMLVNLLVNATKFTKEGSITLALRLDEQGFAEFSVTDTGCGIPLERQSTIFGRFEKLNEGVQGAGLGLSICKLIIKRLGGEIWVDSGYTAGARFVFIHPLKQEVVR